MTRIVLQQADITRLAVDAMVNAANSSLLGGGGVDGAIHRAGGPEILQACQAIVQQSGPCPTGEAVITTAGLLPARHVIHTVGPIWQGGHANEAALLANCYRNSLALAVAHDCRTIAFPNISTGVYGYPKRQAAAVSLSAIRAFLARDQSLQAIYLVAFDDENFQIVQEALAESDLNDRLG